MFWFYSVYFILVVVPLLSLFFFCSGLLSFSNLSVVTNGCFIFDNASFYLIILVVLLGVYSQSFFFCLVCGEVCAYLFFSLVSGILCFCVNHSILFWCFYEVSMLPLLYLIFKESPYSERWLAGWYFSCYLLITSLPLVLLLVYLSIINCSCFFSDWVVGECNISIMLLLSFVFFTKVPLFPFHTWLPIVHAEATSVVSIFLSGYIMKLGLLGVYRCSYHIFGSNLMFYLFICLLLSIFFLVVACSELDGKRWLAFLSLSHIVVPFLGFFVGDYSSIVYSFLFCLGHGVGAGLVFGLLWYCYYISNSRNWLLLKSSISGDVVIILSVVSLLSLCSFPTTIQFFCEVSLVVWSISFFVYLLFWCFYLFLGGVVPLVVCGHLLIRSEYVDSVGCGVFNFYNFLCSLLFWCYSGLLFI